MAPTSVNSPTIHLYSRKLIPTLLPIRQPCLSLHFLLLGNTKQPVTEFLANANVDVAMDTKPTEARAVQAFAQRAKPVMLLSKCGSKFRENTEGQSATPPSSETTAARPSSQT
ncbi:hypothetical protein VB005_02666 [Metarhizium brunneum]